MSPPAACVQKPSITCLCTLYSVRRDCFHFKAFSDSIFFFFFFGKTFENLTLVCLPEFLYSDFSIHHPKLSVV